MSEDGVREVVRAYFDLINAEDFEGLVALFAPVAVVRSAGGRLVRGREELARYYEAVLAPYPEHRDDPVRVIVSGNVATVDIRYEGRLANGRLLAFDALNVYELEGGRIVRLSQWYDTHRVRRMLLAAQAASGPEPAARRLGSVAEATPSRLRAALGLVRRGVSFRLDLPLGQPDPPMPARGPMRHTVARYPGLELAWDDTIDALNTQGGSHWDGLRHLLRPDGTGYGGRPPEDLGVDLWADGICARAVLVDLAGGLGLDWTSGRPVGGEEIDRCARRQGVELRAGDALLLRTGWLAGCLALPPERRPGSAPSPGLAPTEATVAWLEARRFAAVAADNPGLEALPGPPPGESLHDRVIPGLGLAIGELWWLEDLHADSAATGVWDGLLVSLPLRLSGGCASPANAAVLR